MDIGFIIITSGNSPVNLKKIQDTVSEIVDMYGTDQTRYTVIKPVDSFTVRERDIDSEANKMKEGLPKGVNVTVFRSDGMEIVDAIDEAKDLFVKVQIDYI
jgi:hypothetical protein